MFIKIFYFLLFLVLCYNNVVFSQTLYLPAPAASEFNKNAKNNVDSKAVFVFVDQSVNFSADMKSHAIEKIYSSFNPGEELIIGCFSTPSVARYSKIVLRGVLENDIDEYLLQNLKRSDVLKYKKKYYKNRILIKNMINQSLSYVFDGSDKNIPQTDILAFLSEYAKNIKQTHAKQKIFIIISDMLENSSITSFYGQNVVRQIDVEKEIKRVQNMGMIPDFGGEVKIYVVGLGFVQNDSSVLKKNNLPDARKIALLKSFWQKYFEKANARIGEIGCPIMYGEIDTAQ